MAKRVELGLANTQFEFLLLFCTYSVSPVWYNVERRSKEHIITGEHDVDRAVSNNNNVFYVFFFCITDTLTLLFFFFVSL